MGNDPFKQSAIEHGYESWYEFQFHEPKLAVDIYKQITSVKEINLF